MMQSKREMEQGFYDAGNICCHTSGKMEHQVENMHLKGYNFCFNSIPCHQRMHIV